MSGSMAERMVVVYTCASVKTWLIQHGDSAIGWLAGKQRQMFIGSYKDLSIADARKTSKELSPCNKIKLSFSERFGMT